MDLLGGQYGCTILIGKEKNLIMSAGFTKLTVRVGMQGALESAIE